MLKSLCCLSYRTKFRRRTSSSSISWKIKLSFVEQPAVRSSFQQTVSRSLSMSEEPLNKKFRRSMDKTIVIGTHNGTFHCDEALGFYMLRKVIEYEDRDMVESERRKIKLVRSRKAEDLDKCDIVIDVGGIFSHEKRRYDHHMKDFTETLNSLRPEKKWTTKLSSAGLVYAFYGEKVVRALMEKAAPGMKLKLGEETLNLDDAAVEKVYDAVYENFMEEIDAVDNGISICDKQTKYKMTTHLSSRVGGLNPYWTDDEADNQDYQTEKFLKAVELTGKELADKVHYYTHSWLPARGIVERAVANRTKERIVILETSCPWKDHIMDIEEELNLEPEVNGFLYVIYEDKDNKTWRVQCVPKSPTSFKNRLTLPWIGLRDSKLSEESGIEGCIFVHSNGFIGGNHTQEGALRMATKALEIGLSEND